MWVYATDWLNLRNLELNMTDYRCYQCKFAKHYRTVTDERVGFEIYECKNPDSELFEETIPDICMACEKFVPRENI